MKTRPFKMTFLWLVYLPFEQGIPCLLEASKTTTGTILAQVAIP